MKHNFLIFLFIVISSHLIGQQRTNLLISITNEEKTPIKGFELYIKHHDESDSQWRSDNGTNNRPSISQGKFIDSFTMNSSRHNDVEFNLYSSINALTEIINDISPLREPSNEIPVNIKLTKKGYETIYDNLDLTKTALNSYSIVELSYVAKKEPDSKPEYSSFTDPRDGQKYLIIEINNQIWFAENLNYAFKKSWCYFHRSKNLCDEYGRLYDWNSAIDACPRGWHLPSDKEWKELELFLGMSISEVNSSHRGDHEIAKKMKSETGWYSVQFNGNNLSGFSALPGGSYEIINNANRNSNTRKFSQGMIYGYWWTSSSYDHNDAWLRMLRPLDRVDRFHELKKNGYSVRCIKNK